MTTLTTRATEDIEGLKPAEAQRTKNVFALGLISWMYGRPTESTISWLETKFAKRPAVRDANIAAFKAGYNFGETTEIAATPVEIEPAPLEPGEYRNIDGTQAMAIGLIAASVRSGLQMFFASYPITPASELLHHLASRGRFGVRTVQAEDEIAAANMALGAAFAGKLGVTATSGPGMDLKAETIGLAAMVELPMVIVDVQRAGPSTGMPTKTEQGDLLMAIHGRHGESPIPVFAPSTPADCFTMAVEAVRTAIRYRTPVILLGDTFLANSSEPWRIPDGADAARDRSRLRRGPQHRRRLHALPARRARRPALGDPGHPRPPAPARRPREGGRQRQHQLRPGQPRADDRDCAPAKLEKLAEELPELEVDADEGAELLVLGWGSTYGVIRAAARRVREKDVPIAVAHLRHVHPLPANTGEVVQALPEGPGPRAQHRPAAEHHPRRVPRRRGRLQQSRGPADPRRRDGAGDPGGALMSENGSRNGTNGNGGSALPTLTKADFQSDQETRWCPGCGDYAILASVQALMPEIGVPPGAHRLHLGHRLRRALRLLHGHLRDARHPRPRAGARDRDRRLARRPLGLGRHRRRRLALDRRQPPDPRPAAQRPDQDPALQQPDLRPDQGPVLADQREGQDHQVDPVRLRGPALQPAGAGARRRGLVRRPHRSTSRRSTSPRRCGPPPSTMAPPSSRSTRTATSSTTAPSTRSAARAAPRTRSASSTASRSASAPTASAASSAPPTAASPSPTSTRSASRRSSSTTPTSRTRATPSPSPGSPERPNGPTPIGVLRAVERPVYGEGRQRELSEAHAGASLADVDDLLHSGDTWTVS